MRIKYKLLSLLFVLINYQFSFAQVVPSTNKNSVVTYTPVDPTPTVTLLKSMSVERQGIDVLYFDGLGRLEQTVMVQATPGLNDMVQPIDYDEFGREKDKYLPYETTGGTTGSFIPKSTWQGAQNSFYENIYSNEGSHAKSHTQFEESTLNRVLWQRGPGKDWEDNNKVVSYNYGTNSANEVRLYKVTDDGTLQFNGYYSAGTLTVLEIKNEDNRVVQEWKDLAGQVILKRSYTLTNKGGEAVETYYVYDDMGRLRAVLPPLAVKEQADGQKVKWVSGSRDFPNLDPGINTYIAEEGGTISLKPGFTFTASPGNGLNFKVTSGLVYRYEYDERGRVTEKKTPGADRVFMVYDNLDRLVLEQDGEQRIAGNWIAHTYDAFGRELKKGVVTLSGVANTQAAVQTWFNANPSALDASINAGVLLVQSWYDSYDGLPAGFESLEFTPSSSNYGSVYSRQTNGLLIAQEVRVLNPEVGMPITLKSKFYYDPIKGKLIQISSQRYDDGNIRQSYLHNFRGQVIQEQVRLNNRTGLFYIERRMSYDHAGRVTLTEQRTDNNAWVTVAANEYDALGRNITQKLGVYEANVVQEVNSSYNIRGWLTAINNPDNLGTDLFAMRLNYQNLTLPNGAGEPAGDAQYAGNITETDWAYRDGNPGDVKRMAYRYWYDGLSRLTDGRGYSNTSSAWTRDVGKFDTKYEYDLQGNIKKLSRYGISGTTNAQIDNLAYTYDGNRLQGVIDNSGKGEGYLDLNKTNDFLYNANGSMKKDLDKGIDITYNLLNLPQQVKETSRSLSVSYVYTATGTKLAALYLKGSDLVGGNRYIGPVVQRYDNKTAGWINDYVPTAEGRLACYKGSIWVPQYFLKDHLGNTRAIVEKNTSYSSTTGWAKQVWQGNYYPFGMTLGQSYVGENNQLTYNGKERQDFALNGRSLDWLDYGARFYDAALGRWHTIDPLAEIMSDISPYAYCFNNPIIFIDPTGMGGVVSNDNLNATLINRLAMSASDLSIFGYIPMNMEYNFTINQGSFMNVNENMSYLNPLPAQVTGGNTTSPSSTNDLLKSYGRGLVSVLNQAQYSVPVWGACKQFGDCVNTGDYLGAGVNFALAFAEAFTLGYGAEIRLGMNAAKAAESGAQGFKSLGAAAKGYSRGLWQLTDEGASSIATNKTWGKFYKSASDETWWAIDKYGHGGSAFKVFRETPKGLEWIKDADKFGNYIIGKHKGTTGTFIPWKTLNIIE